MAAESEMVYRWVEWLKCGTDDQQYQAALALRNLAGDAGSKHLIREAGGIESLLRLLDAGTESMLTVVGAETLSCLAADDCENRVRGREAGKVAPHVGLHSTWPAAGLHLVICLRLRTAAAALHMQPWLLPPLWQ